MNNSAIEIIGYEKCTGCYGCLNKCPIEGAINFEKTQEGFYKPFLTEKCIQCGICKKGCPVLTKVNQNSVEDLEVFSCWSKNEEIIKNSSSGGIFSELAKEYLNNDGVVFGAKWKDGEIVHCGISKIDQLQELQKSKYLQSKINKSYLEVKKYLGQDKKVLFVGTPCEIAALNTITTHENLLTVDIVCHGIPSYTIYEKYIKERFNMETKDITVDFRSKDTGWENYSLIFKNKNEVMAKNNHNEDMWFRGFLADIYLNTPCYNCEFRTMPRVSDITLGDFWGVPEKIRHNIVVNETKWEIALKGNPCLYNYKMDDSKREEFFKNYSKYTFIKLHKKYFKFPNKFVFFIKKIYRYLKKRSKNDY